MRKLIALALLPLAATWVDGANAQSVIRITNANNHEIPLAGGTTVSFDSNGNLNAECALSNGVCTALSGGGTAPTLSFTRTNSGNITAGQSIQLNWTATGAVACSGTNTGPGSTNWPGVKAVTGSAVSVPINTQGSYVFSLQCFSSTGANSTQTIAVTVEESQVVQNCNLPSHPAIQPAGFTRIDQTWEQAFKAPNAATTSFTYPDALSFLVPILVEKGQYKAISFVPAANETVQLQWFQAQVNGLIGYSFSRPAQGIMISISPCAGDFRNIGEGSDPAADSKCRWFADQLNQQFYSSVPGVNACQVTAGVVHYINVIAADPAGGITQGEDSCGQPSFTGCDITVKSSRL